MHRTSTIKRLQIVTLLGLAAVAAAVVLDRAGADVDTNGVDEKITAKIDTVDLATLKKMLHAARGNVLVVNFWATWCPPCVAEMPELAKFYRAYKDRDVKFLSLSADHPTTIDDSVRPFVQEYGIPFDVHVLNLGGPDELIEIFGRDWGGGLPATFVFDQQGESKKFWMLQIGLKDLKEVVDPLLEAEKDK